MDINEIISPPDNPRKDVVHEQKGEHAMGISSGIETRQSNVNQIGTDKIDIENQFISFDKTIRKISSQLTQERRRRSEAGIYSLNSDNNNNNGLQSPGLGSSYPSIIEEMDNDMNSNFDTIYSDESDVGNASILFNTEPMKQADYISLLVGLFVAVGGFLFGYDTGLINSIAEMPYVRENLAPNHVAFTTKELSILVSFLSLGTFIGALFTPIASDRVGRKIMIIFSTAIIFSIGNSLQVASKSMGLLIAGRVVSGLGIGIISAIVPSYQAEAAKKNLRGAIISTYQWAITWGLLASSAVSQGTHLKRSAASYRIPLGLQYVWSSVLAVGMFFLPESPRYYVLRDKLDKAAQSLSFLRGVPVQDSGLLEELVEIKATYDYEQAVGSDSMIDCFISSKKRPKQRLRMFTGIALQVLQQFSGINFIFYYGINFLDKTGIHRSYIISFIMYAVNVAFNIPGLFLVDNIGRRKLLIYGGILMTISNFIIAIVGASTESSIANKVMIAFICVFIAGYSATWGGVVWVLSAEIYPLGVRAKCTAICAASNWLANFICALITPYIIDMGTHETVSIGPKIYFIWGSLNALGIVIVYLTVFETRGLTLEQIDELYESCPNAIQSDKWNKIIRERKISFNNITEVNAVPQNPESHVMKSSSSSKGTTFNTTTITGFTFVDNNNGNVQIGCPSTTPTNITPIDMDITSKEPITNNINNSEGVIIATEPLRYMDPPVVTNDVNYWEENIDPIDRLHAATPPIPLSDLTPIGNIIPDRINESDIVDLGNGLTLNTYRRGPPSISSETSGSESISRENNSGHESYPRYSDREHMNLINDYVSQIMNGSSNGRSQQNSVSTNAIVTNTTDSVDLGHGYSLNPMSGGPPPILSDEEDDNDSDDEDGNEFLYGSYGRSIDIDNGIEDLRETLRQFNMSQFSPVQPNNDDTQIGDNYDPIPSQRNNVSVNINTTTGNQAVHETLRQFNMSHFNHTNDNLDPNNCNIHENEYDHSI